MISLNTCLKSKENNEANQILDLRCKRLSYAYILSAFLKKHTRGIRCIGKYKIFCFTHKFSLTIDQHKVAFSNKSVPAII